MPLTKKGKKIMAAMKKKYGPGKGEEVFYASANKGTIDNVHRSPPAGVQGFTTTTDLPHKANHGTSPVPEDKSETGASVPGGPPDDVKTHGVFHGDRYKGEKQIDESADKGPSVTAKPPADVMKFNSLGGE